MFNKSLKSVDVPQDWKIANVTVVYKNGKRNYRPVSLTVNLCKIFESVMRGSIIEHLEKHKLISGSQHGFVRNRSC